MLLRMVREIKVSDDWFGCVLVTSFYVAMVFSESVTQSSSNVSPIYNLLQKVVIHWWNIFNIGTLNPQGQLNDRRSLIPWGLGVCGLSLHLGSSKSCKTLEQEFIFQISTLYHLLRINTHTTHNSYNRSHEGLTLKTSALKLFTLANLRYQLSW